MVLVSGYSGIGKSALVNELNRSLISQNSFFGSGKFDQFKRDVPYPTLVQAFQDLIRLLVSRPEEELNKWRKALQDALGPNGFLFTDLVPGLKLIVGEQPAVPDLPLLDAQRRFQLTFRRFIEVFATQEHPVILFFNDLQWVDAPTLDLMEDILTQSDVRHLMLIGAYRDNEVDSFHPLIRKLVSFRSSGVPIEEIVLGPLSQDDLTHFVTDGFHCKFEHAAPLATLICEKTTGNPLFAIQFVSELVECGLLAFDYDQGHWSWNLKSISAKAITENVADLMVGRLNRLPVETQVTLQLLACFGVSTDFVLLQEATLESDEEIHRRLWKAAEAGLIFRSENCYEFLHDRVQEAAYSMIPEKSRLETHLQIGRLLNTHTPPGKHEERIFEIVNQLNRAIPLITSNDERKRIAELNLIAARRAKVSTAYASALSYLMTIGVLVTEDTWDTDYDLMFSVEYLTAECELLTADMESADKRLSKLAAKAKRAHDLAVITRLQLTLYTASDRLDHGIEICLGYLRSSGISWSAHPTDEDVRREFDRIWPQLGDRQIEDLLNLPLVSNPDILDILEVLTEILTPAVFFDKNLCALAICHIVNISLEYGNSEGASVACVWFGIVVGPRFGRYEDAFRFARLGYNLLGQSSIKR
jgi:predicted ATPase